MGLAVTLREKMKMTQACVVLTWMTVLPIKYSVPMIPTVKCRSIAWPATIYVQSVRTVSHFLLWFDVLSRRGLNLYITSDGKGNFDAQNFLFSSFFNATGHKILSMIMFHWLALYSTNFLFDGI